MGEPASGSALRTRGLVSFLGMLWALLEISIHRECCLVLAFLQGTGRGFKLGQILLSGFIICSVIGEVWLLFTLQMPAQLSPFLEDVLIHPGCVSHPCLCVLCSGAVLYSSQAGFASRSSVVAVSAALRHLPLPLLPSAAALSTQTLLR